MRLPLPGFGPRLRVDATIFTQRFHEATRLCSSTLESRRWSLVTSMLIWEFIFCFLGSGFGALILSSHT
jgi:hypothetical protein